MKKSLLILLFSITANLFIYSDLPPVADVFKGMSEEDIIRQVQEAEKFLQDLQQFGSPEDQAQFNKILEETLNSMSEQDFQDIQNIAKMVEPHLQINDAPVPAPAPAVSPKAAEPVAEPIPSSDSVENFKTMITSIHARIDEILQKLDSSKACKEEVETLWINRATLNSLKRQIAQLKINRLAEKLSKKDLSDEDKALADNLNKFLKDITAKNNSLVIEDTFGLPENRAQEQKYLAQAKDILTLFDNYIDSLIPQLEKFLTKWDPEALQLAKESSAKTAKAQKEAQDALARKPSANATPPARQPGQPSQSGQKSGYGSSSGYPDYFDYGYSQPGSSSFGSASAGSVNTPSSPSSTPNSPASSPAAKAAKSAQKINQNLQAQHVNIVDDFKEAIDSYFNKYTTDAEDKNTTFLKDTVNYGYKALNPILDDIFTKTPSVENYANNPSRGTQVGIEGFRYWHDQHVLGFIDKVFMDLGVDRKAFTLELKSAPRLCEDINAAVHDMKADEVKQIVGYLDKLEQRFNNYSKAFDETLQGVNESFHNTMKYLSDANNNLPPYSDAHQARTIYRATHNNFVAKLRSDIGDKINLVLSNIDDLKRKATSKSKRKSKSSALTQAVQESSQKAPVAE